MGTDYDARISKVSHPCWRWRNGSVAGLSLIGLSCYVAHSSHRSQLAGRGNGAGVQRARTAVVPGNL
jgi:hypothetical protein